MLKELILKSRSYRRFYQDEKIDIKMLREFVDLARCCPSTGNLQPLKYILSNEPRKNSLIFDCLTWAGYLQDWSGPAAGERPAAYIIILGDKEIGKNFDMDAGIAAQSMLLCAVENGLGGCMFRSIQRDKLRKALAIPSNLDILLVVAIGKAKERVVLEQVGADEDIKYWRDESGVHHVPKRCIDEIIID